MFCGISGKPPKFPVLSPVSKCVFEKELIVQYVEEEGKDPITNAPLTLDELIEISSTPQQAALTNTLNSSTLNSNYSIPNLLSSLQNEWDAVMLENFRLRKQLDAMTKQLSTALYERDAAKIVAAKALKERERIVSEMNALTSQLGTSESAGNIKEELLVSTIPSLVLETLKKQSRAYMEQTKKIVDQLIFPTDSKFKLEWAWNIPDDVQVTRITQLITGNRRKYVFSTIEPGLIVLLQDFNTVEKIQTELADDVDFLSPCSNSNNLLFSSESGSIGIYNVDENSTSELTIPHDKVIFMIQHEYILKDYFLFVDRRGKVIFSSSDCLTAYEVYAGSPDNDYHQAALHKDGLLLALVQGDRVELFNLSQPDEAPTVFQVGQQLEHNATVERVEFSANGYWMIVSCGGDVVSFDLRKGVGTLAVNPLTLTDSRNIMKPWDIDICGKNVMIAEKGDAHQILLSRFTYKKSKKAWESVPESSFALMINEDQDYSTLSQVRLLYSELGTSILLRFKDRILLYSIST